MDFAFFKQTEKESEEDRKEVQSWKKREGKEICAQDGRRVT